jgi:hypothetical protein
MKSVPRDIEDQAKRVEKFADKVRRIFAHFPSDVSYSNEARKFSPFRSSVFYGRRGIGVLLESACLLCSRVSMTGSNIPFPAPFLRFLLEWHSDITCPRRWTIRC